mgnify:CR=1 FL=1|jgi:hypothetical protein
MKKHHHHQHRPANVIPFPGVHRGPQTPPPPAKHKPTANGNGDGLRIYTITASYDGLPGCVLLTVRARNFREAVGAAYLIADRFATETIERIKA